MKVGVLGAGDMGATVIDHLKKCNMVNEIIAQDIRPERIEELKQKFQIHATTNLEEILNDPSLPLVFITASNDAHKDLAIRAIQSGKAVMCEKPMATTLADAEEMVRVAEKHRAFLQIGFELRYSKLYTKVKEWVDAGLLGQVVNVNCIYICCEFLGKKSWRCKKNLSGGMFGEKLSHYVDLPRWWVGSDVPVNEVYSVCSPNVISYYEVRDNYQTMYRFANGAVGHITFMMAPAAKFNGDPLQNAVNQQQGDGHVLDFVIEGTKGAATAGVFDRRIKRWEFKENGEGFISTWVEDLTWDPSEDDFYFHNTCDQTHDIVRRVKEGLSPKTPPQDAYQTMRLCFAAERSADLSRVVHLNEL
jgi:predicted dehydrogenase